MKCTYIIFRHKKPCRHVRTYFREGRFLYNVLALLQYFSRPIQLDTSTSTSTTSTSARSCSTSASTSNTSTAPASAPAPTPAPAPAPAPLAPAPSAPAPPAPPKCRFHYSFARSTRAILRKGCTQRHQNVDFTTVSYDLHAQFYERVAPSTARSQFYHSFGRSTRTILRKGRSVNSKMSILLQFRAIDTYDLRRNAVFFNVLCVGWVEK